MLTDGESNSSSVSSFWFSSIFKKPLISTLGREERKGVLETKTLRQSPVNENKTSVGAELQPH